jgi:molybdopterin converting factor small subunit
MVRLLFLGRFSELAPAGLEQIALPEGVRTLSELWNWVAQESPGLGQVMASTPTKLILNQCVAHDLSRPVVDGDEVAFLPPMSGG